MSELTKRDQITEDTYTRMGFDKARETNGLTFTSARVGVPNYNVYEKNEFKVTGYLSDHCQYDGRLDGLSVGGSGRGRDMMNIDPYAYDKIVFQSMGITGDQGMRGPSIALAARQFKRTNDQPTFLDGFGDVLSFRNVGFEKVVSNDVMAMFRQDQCQGVLGGLRQMKDTNSELVLSLAIGGWKLSGPFSKLAADPERRAAFINGTLDVLQRFPMFTEVQLDWQYPCMPSEPGNDFCEEDGANYAKLIRELRGQLDRNIKIGISVCGNVDHLKKVDIKNLIDSGVDNVLLMTMDWFGSPYSVFLGHQSNLKGVSGEDQDHSIERVVNYMESIGVPLSKLNIGYCGYSRNASGAQIDSVSPLKGTFEPHFHSGLGTFEEHKSEYYDIVYNYLDFNKQSGKNGFNLYTDTYSDSDFLFNPQSHMFMSLDTPRTVRNKADYVQRKGLGGLFTSTIDQDHGLLINAAREGFGCQASKDKLDMSQFYFTGNTYL